MTISYNSPPQSYNSRHPAWTWEDFCYCVRYIVYCMAVAGEIPMPEAIPGPKGDKGPAGPQGP